jgi:endonuclease III
MRGIPLNADKRIEIFERFRAANPTPETELNYASPFQLLIAVILSAQATDKGVNLATAGLFTAAPTAHDMAALGEDGVRDFIRTIGLFNAKAKNVAATCRALVEHHNGEVPQSREALEVLPGVGRKTANVVLNTAFGQATMAVDTHIFRVSNRTRIAPGRNVREVEDRLLRLVPKAYLLHAHHWLILHGRYVCKARSPDCAACAIADLCEFKKKTNVSR